MPTTPRCLCRLGAVLALAALLWGCRPAQPAGEAIVGHLGTVEISAGLYRLAWYTARQQATAGGKAEAEAFLRSYAAAETHFAALGGALSAAQRTAAEEYARQLYEGGKSEYEANGIPFEALAAYQYNFAKRQALAELAYGPQSAAPVADEALAAHMQTQMYAAVWLAVPLYSAATLQMATEAQAAQIGRLCAGAVQAYNAGAAGAALSAAEAQARLQSCLAGLLPAAAQLLGEPAAAQSDGGPALTAQLFSAAALQSAFGAAGAQALWALGCGQAAAVPYGGRAVLVLLRLEPAALFALEDVRADVLWDATAGALQQQLEAEAAALPAVWDEQALAALGLAG